MAITINSLRHNGIGTLRVYIKGGSKSTETLNCNRFEAKKTAWINASINGGIPTKAFYNGKIILL